MSLVTARHPVASPDDLVVLRSVCRDVRDCLEQAKRSLDEEIRAYPTPIPRCDAQFNGLYEQRTRLAQALVLANTAVEGSAGPEELTSFARYFVHSPPCADGRDEAELRSRLREALSRHESGAVRFASPQE
jgi:hypothetical protein